MFSVMFLALLLVMGSPLTLASSVDRANIITVSGMAYIEFATEYSFSSNPKTMGIVKSFKREDSFLTKREIEIYQPNEMGDIMIVMYHDLIENDEDEGEYSRTFKNFKRDIDGLMQEGYIPITMRELVTGDFDLPIGTTPVVITFDDGHSSDIAFNEDGSLIENTAVGILESFRSPYYEPRATFYLNGPQAFGDWEYDEEKIYYMLKKGYEIANHTSNHKNLSECTREEAKDEILTQAERLYKFTNTKSFNFALPFGEKFEDYEKLIRSGWLGDYEMLSSVNVGWSPVASYYSKDFNELNLNRITCGDDDYELTYWRKYFRENPSERYRSDGNKYTLTMPASRYDDIDKEKQAAANLKVILYDEEYEIIKK